MNCKRIAAFFLACTALLALAGCLAQGPSSSSGASASGSTAAKDYVQILHDARSSEDNEYYMIFSSSDGAGFAAQYGNSADYESASQLSDEVKNMLLPLLNLEEGSYTELAASVSAMMVRSYGVAIVKPAEGKTDEVKASLEAFVLSQQQSMQNYLEDQYQIAKAAKVETVPSGEVVLVCCEDADKVLASIKAALAA